MTDTVRWLRGWVGAAAVVLTLVTVLTAFSEEMPDSHHVAVPLAAAVMLAAWVAELAGWHGWRLGLIAATVLANVWLTLIGHVSANFLFLMLLVAWIGVVGTRTESTAALVSSLATVALAAAIDSHDGQIAWASWAPWSIGLVMVWLMSYVLRWQERLVDEMRRLRSDAEQRSQELASLLTVSRTVASTLETKPLMDAVLDALGSVVDYRGAAIMTLDDAGDALTLAHARPLDLIMWPSHGRGLEVADLGSRWERLRQDQVVFEDEAEDDRRSTMWVPLVARGRIIGVLGVINPSPGAYGPREADVALAIARQAAVAMENARLHERERQSAVLEERQRLARELHDSVSQSLYAISLHAEAAGRALADGDTAPVAANLREIRDTTREALDETRLLVFELRPPLLEEQGLAAALRTRLLAVESRAGLVAQLAGDGEAERLPPEMEQELYRLAQEALNNVLKHAHARSVAVQLEVEHDRVRLEIVDDGVGFEPALGGSGGFGLPGMRERAEQLGGSLHVESAPGSGTRVLVDVPR